MDADQIICIYFNNKMFSMLIHAGYEGYRHFKMDTPKKGIEKDPVVLNLFSYFLTLNYLPFHKLFLLIYM